jgi:hypothetical protein
MKALRALIRHADGHKKKDSLVLVSLEGDRLTSSIRGRSPEGVAVFRLFLIEFRERHITTSSQGIHVEGLRILLRDFHNVLYAIDNPDDACDVRLRHE